MATLTLKTGERIKIDPEASALKTLRWHKAAQKVYAATTHGDMHRIVAGVFEGEVVHHHTIAQKIINSKKATKQALDLFEQVADTTDGLQPNTQPPPLPTGQPAIEAELVDD